VTRPAREPTGTREATPSRWATRFAALPAPRLLALDVDGTLAPIAERPERARVPKRVVELLGRLTELPALHVALLTGRDPKALRRLVPLRGLWRAVEHGRRWAAPGRRLPPLRPNREERSALHAFATWAQRHALPEGAVLERKPNSVGLHVRPLLSERPQTAERLLREARERAEALGLRARAGRALLEAEAGPAADKGRALRTIVRESGARGVLFAGDDTTDVPALRAARELGGLALFVRSAERARPPEASGVLDGPEAVAELLEALLERLGPSHPAP